MNHRIARAIALRTTLLALAMPAAAFAQGGPADAPAAPEARTGLDEIVVVARRRAESLQETPLAVTALTSDTLAARGINSLTDFTAAPSPFLQVSPYAGSGLLPIIGIRGLATDDPGQGSNESAVGIYLDGVYLGRAQGATMEFGDIAQLEVLRGPQGTLFGRNALGGAINIISRKPTGVFGIEQEFTYGSYNQVRSLTHLNLPALGKLRLKGDFLYSRRDGWVKNRAPGFRDYGAYDRIGGRVAANLEISDTLSADFMFDISNDRSTPGYIQRTTPNDLSPQPVEPDRVTDAQIPAPIDYSRTRTGGHALTLAWTPSAELTVKSISAYRWMEYDNRDFFPGTYLYIPTSASTALLGLSSPQNDEQNQFSQEIQATGTLRDTPVGKVSYAAGLYYFQEHVDSEFKLGSAAYGFGPSGILDPASANLLVPQVLLIDPASNSQIRTKSYAGYAQVSIRPAVLDGSIELTGGLRYTHDDKRGRQLIFNGAPSGAAFRLNSNSLDYNVSIAWTPVKDINLYVRNATGYRAGGVSLRDPGFVPFQPDDVKSWEVGLKSEFLDHRVRLNVALFDTHFDNMRTSFSDPANPSVTRLFNAAKTTSIKGAEVELTVQPTDGLVLNASYSHLDSKVAPQANPFAPAIVQPFELAQAPRHSGSLAADWTVGTFGVGKLAVHGDAYFTSRVTSVPQLVNTGTPYELYNARVTLSDIPLASLKASASIWVQNLTDAHYRPWEMAWIGATSTTRLVQFGTPRTVGGTLSVAF